VPALDESGIRRSIDRFDLAAQTGERAPLDLAQDLGIAPFSLSPARPEVAVDDDAVGIHFLQGLAHQRIR
jgi:hypothetical protein